MKIRHEQDIRMIPIDQIVVVNERARGKAKFKQIVDNISRLGLKKPITVARRPRRNGQDVYDLVCGQGRLEAYKALGQQEVPAIVVEADREELLLMGLAENLARRRYVTVELLKEIGQLKERGYTFEDIARKTDLDKSYVKGIIRLLKTGEERLLQAVEKGQIPISIAVTIASANDEDVQRALTEAYEKNDLRGKSLLKARRLIEQRRNDGKTIRRGIDPRKQGRGRVTSEKLRKAYQDESARQRLIVRKAKLCETRMLFVLSALRRLFNDEHFVNLLRAESLDTLPQQLADELKPRSN